MNTTNNEWRTALLEDVVRFGNGKAIKPGGVGRYPVYGSNGIIGGCEDFRYENGVIIGRVGAYCGSVAYCPNKFWASDNTLVAFPASEQPHKERANTLAILARGKPLGLGHGIDADYRNHPDRWEPEEFKQRLLGISLFIKNHLLNFKSIGGTSVGSKIQTLYITLYHDRDQID